MAERLDVGMGHKSYANYMYNVLLASALQRQEAELLESCSRQIDVLSYYMPAHWFSDQSAVHKTLVNIVFCKLSLFYLHVLTVYNRHFSLRNPLQNTAAFCSVCLTNSVCI